METENFLAPLYYYGTDIPSLRLLIEQDPSLGETIHRDLPYLGAEIVWAAENEMCITVEDALSRRTRALFLDARAAMEAAPGVASLLAKRLNKDASWEKQQVEQFSAIARNYLPQTI